MFYSPSASRPVINANNELSSRRPSLPHVYDDLPVSSPSGARRPRSAGQNAELEPLRVPSVPRKLRSKYLLLNLFRKAGDTSTAGNNTPESPHTRPQPLFLVSPPRRVIHKASSMGILIGMMRAGNLRKAELVDAGTCICTPCCGRF